MSVSHRTQTHKALDFCSIALLTELASLIQGWSSTVDAYTRSDIKAQQHYLENILQHYLENIINYILYDNIITN